MICYVTMCWSPLRAGGHVRPLRHRPHDATRGRDERPEGAQGRRGPRVPAEAAV